MTRPGWRWAAAALGTAVRVALGLLWINEGAIKLRSGFGASDILLVADGAAENGRVPDYFQLFASTILHDQAGLFGFVTPLVEIGLGVALIAGILTAPAALASLATLLMYWSADQLIDEYPVMALLSGIVLGFSTTCSRISATSAVIRVLRSRHGTPAAVLERPELRRWL
ncbi:DoxX family membrane protein [Rathayibacter sp. VKM Ac-2927]|uniref:DoxX family membrane protein n=1 Tax=Rathayibacter sp. VKM Ac-2927 TaxID=2929478 RepID=UPI001FB47E68|nr:DoxX family membrane protein [Rathayibacter sp. VKM Ac-2927]MCJ1688814.1 DoxX family membrane protein [Rathayibacter sp. VKM Ac-2927]